MTSISMRSTLAPPNFLLPPNSYKRTGAQYTKSSGHSLPFSRHFHLLLSQKNPNFKVIRGMNLDGDSELPVELCYTRTLSPALTLKGGFVTIEEEFEKLVSNPPSSKSGIVRFQVIRGMNLDGDSELPVELCYTRTLSPTLTLKRGFVKIEEEFEKLVSNPPSSKSGIVRFQVAVPPSAKALSWFCSQPQSPGVFPQFYMSKNNLKHPPQDSDSFNGEPGVSGIGASVSFMGSSSSVSRKWNAIKRYLSVDSPLIRAYGFIGIEFGTKPSFIKHETGSLCFFIPQIELDECEGTSLLAATFAWDDYSVCTFDRAVYSLKNSLSQASKENCQDRCINSVLKNSDFLEDYNVQMVCLNAVSLEEKDINASSLQTGIPFFLNETSASCQYCFRLSSTIAVTHNVVDRPSEVSSHLQYSANINAVWASLIVEECSRLGLRYFCIAPGSRSSPLAVAASTHPRTICISCFDERSLAFHAVGYARGCYLPAVVITSSGTAVSNLLPAVVEASQDFVPLLLLTADRPPELQDAGANQAINQVNHFGSFVRFSFNLPAPSDCIPARMVLTTVDSAVYSAIRVPNGPVHINCPFREPLEDSPREWMLSCLKGLDIWMSSSEAFTKYIRIEHSNACNSIPRQLDDVSNMIQCANKGLLLIGAMHTEDEMWAALLLAKHLSWPTVADILSGVRFKKVLTASNLFAEKILFIDHLDHALLSDSVRDWVQPDVVLQIGSRITSKRVAQMLEACSPCSYILVDKHPYRHDPSHIVTHRIHCTVNEFAESLFELKFSRMSSTWGEYMQALNMMVARELEFQIHSEYSLTEPHVAQVLSEALPDDAALFIGNSMVIRDADMYGNGWMDFTVASTSILSSLDLSCLGVRVSGNRGASGIDGLLSTAIGFAVGSYKRVFCLIGDVSFLYDTNGLAILKQRAWRKPLTIVVINNHGGAIFSLLPIAERTEPSIMKKYFYTSHNTSISKLCEAHSVNHLAVQTKVDLKCALFASLKEGVDCIIEVESCIEENASFHSTLKRFALQAADNTLSSLLSISVPDQISSAYLWGEIHKAEYLLYRIQLTAPPTSTRLSGNPSMIYKEGYLLAIYLEDGIVGFGEVAPLEIHKENLQDVEEQLRFLIHMIQGAKLSYLLPLLRGSFSSWIWECLGIQPHSLFPSVRCGLEMAVLNALAARQGCSLAKLLHHQCSSSKIHICALLDSNATPKEVANVAVALVGEGFTTIKVKVGRRADASEDATVIQEIRKKVGYQVKLRADANRMWTYEQASNFASSVQHCDLQYIEEPVNSEDDIVKFCEETGLPVALDETIDNIQGDPYGRLARFIHPGIVAVVIKPSVVGGFENASFIAKWAQKHDKMAVISSAFESSLGLASYVQFSHYLEQQNADICKVKNKEPGEPIAHGLGTFQWLKQDVTTEPLKIRGHPYNEVVEASLEDADRLLKNFKINPNVIQRKYTGEQVRKYQMTVDYEDISGCFEVLEVGETQNNTVVVFLHGFLGTGEDWVPMMKALSTSTRCISFDLPGHGRSRIDKNPSMPIEAIASMVTKLIHNITTDRVVLVGYSMGARIALYMTLRCGNQVDGAVLISGSPGLNDERARKRRVDQDNARAKSLKAHGLKFFLENWYSSELWRSLKSHPHFEKILSTRMQHNDVNALANTLQELSVGRQPSLWDDLKQTKKPLLFVYGENDEKFKKINQKIFDEFCENGEIHEIKEIPSSGHAVYLENPLSVINAISKFLLKLGDRLQ